MQEQEARCGVNHERAWEFRQGARISDRFHPTANPLLFESSFVGPPGHKSVHGVIGNLPPRSLKGQTVPSGSTGPDAL